LTSGLWRSTKTAPGRRPWPRSEKSRRTKAGFPPGAKPGSAAPSNRGPTGASAASARGALPIPAFFDERKNAYLDAGVARAIADKFARLGTNFWYDSPAEKILAGVTLPAGWPAPASLTSGRDTLDVWIDSGSSHAAVLKNQQGRTQWPADLYLEGSDQHRGWFQSSLWTGVIACGGAPYKAVLTHGFIVDHERNKISKSSTYEKPQTSDAYVADYGADVIRLWIVSQDFRDDIPISREILSHVTETYRLTRNTLRYQLSVLHDFDPAHHAVPVEQMDTLDRWALLQTSALLRDATAAYEAYEFHRVYQLCNQFCAVTLSATYHDILKDRLYTLGTNAPLRRSSQTAIHHIFQTLVKLLAPIVTFTTDEAWSFATAKAEYADDSIHLQDWPVAPASWSNSEIEADVAALLRVRTQVNEAIEPLRAAGRLGKSLDALRHPERAGRRRDVSRAGEAPRFSARTFHRFPCQPRRRRGFACGPPGEDEWNNRHPCPTLQ